MQYKCEMLDILNSPNVEVLWIKKVTYNETINAEFCDYMICSSSATNLGTDVFRTVTGATLVTQEKTDGGYDVSIYEDVSTSTAITQDRQYSETVVIGVRCSTIYDITGMNFYGSINNNLFFPYNGGTYQDFFTQTIIGKKWDKVQTEITGSISQVTIYAKDSSGTEITLAKNDLTDISSLSGNITIRLYGISNDTFQTFSLIFL